MTPQARRSHPATHTARLDQDTTLRLIIKAGTRP